MKNKLFKLRYKQKEYKYAGNTFNYNSDNYNTITHWFNFKYRIINLHCFGFKLEIKKYEK